MVVHMLGNWHGYGFKPW